MRRSDSSPARPAPPAAQTLGCSPQSGVHVASKPPESLDFEEKTLDEDRLRRHVARLARVAEDLEVTLKLTPQSPAEHVALQELVLPLVENRAFGGQIEYTYWGCRWLDTFIAGQTGIRLVRLQLSG